MRFFNKSRKSFPRKYFRSSFGRNSQKKTPGRVSGRISGKNTEIQEIKTEEILEASPRLFP